MIFIAILDPRFSRFSNETINEAILQNRGYLIHRQWCIYHAKATGQHFTEQVLATTDNNFQPYVCAPMIAATLQRAFQTKDNVYVYVCTHGNQDEKGQFIKLNENAYLRDNVFMELLMTNNALHIDVFLETCHASGMYDPDIKWYKSDTMKTIDPRRVYVTLPTDKAQRQYGMFSCMANFTIFTSSIEEDRCMTMRVDTDVAKYCIGHATKAIYDEIGTTSIFNYTPYQIQKIVNRILHTQQYAQIFSPAFVATW